MPGRNPSEPSLCQMVDVESLVPTNDQLRKIDALQAASIFPFGQFRISQVKSHLAVRGLPARE